MKITNRRAFYDFHLLEKLEAGIHLTGPEVKSVKGGHMSLDGAFVRIIGSEAYLVNAQIFPYPHARLENYDPRRTRKLLLHKKEIITLKSKTQSGLTLVPLSCYTKQGLVKLELALASVRRNSTRESLKKAAAEERRWIVDLSDDDFAKLESILKD
ncbi:SsrA-binding protein SmpB [Candidatus Gottesmanbacteria bacterium]|nr:SsrA-binding protein SmpB [Candidatus Gottesmanbacteria bacterium]